jgi:hypothetical protein
MLVQVSQDLPGSGEVAAVQRDVGRRPGGVVGAVVPPDPPGRLQVPGGGLPGSLQVAVGPACRRQRLQRGAQGAVAERLGQLHRQLGLTPRLRLVSRR